MLIDQSRSRAVLRHHRRDGVAFDPCIPTRGAKVPDRPEWIHEIKHDGYRLIVQRDGKRVRLFTRNGHDWSGRYPLHCRSRAAQSQPPS